MMHKILPSTLLAFAILLAGCAGARQAAEPHSLEGEWSYHVDSDEGAYKGTLSFTSTDEGLVGTISPEEADEQANLVDIAFSDPQLTFEFTSPEYGLLKVNVTVEAGAFTGWMEVPRYATSVSMRGARLTP